MAEPPDAAAPEVIAAGAGAAAPTSDRRARFREAVSGLATRSTSDDLVRWMLVPGSIAVLLGFSVMLLGWVGAARTAREIEQIPYLISGGLIGLALVVLGGLLLVSTFWVAVLRKLSDERAVIDDTELEALRSRIRELEAAAVPANGTRRSTAKPKARVKA